jgi:hypothetical protein
MISTAHATTLLELGLEWSPEPGDRFRIRGQGFESDVFTISELTIEAHEHATGTVLGFNGTTEWALDSVALEDSLWLPREDQLRALLGGAFRSLRREIGGAEDGAHVVLVVIDGTEVEHRDLEAEEAYAKALIAVMEAQAPTQPGA